MVELTLRNSGLESADARGNSMSKSLAVCSTMQSPVLPEAADVTSEGIAPDRSTRFLIAFSRSALFRADRGNDELATSHHLP